jgi:ABC-type Fe3+ transport system permease subunit
MHLLPLLLLLQAATLVSAGLYALFAAVVWRSGSTQDKKRWRVSIVFVIAIMTFLGVVLLGGIVVASTLGNSVGLSQPRVALTYSAFVGGLTLGLGLGVIGAAFLVLVTLLTAWRFSREFDYSVENAWYEWGWKKWLGPDLPDSAIHPLIH